MKKKVLDKKINDFFSYLTRNLFLDKRILSMNFQFQIVLKNNLILNNFLIISTITECIYVFY